MIHVGQASDLPPDEVLKGLEVRLIYRDERAPWDDLMRQYHYLGLQGLVGESLRYVALFQGHWLALLGWAAGALKCKVRDQWIGWPCSLQWQRLTFVANNSRFLILPQVHLANLASRILALTLRRLSRDWQACYGHPIWLAETFVDPRYFKGTCYRAAGWLFLGYSRGFSKSSDHYSRHDQPKMVFVRPLDPQAKQKLSAPYMGTQLPPKVKPMKLSQKNADELLSRLMEIPDPRMARGIRHRKIPVLAICICAIMSNARSFSAIAQWASGCSQNLLRRLWCRYDSRTQQYQPPSEPTIRRFLQTVNAHAVDQALYGWLQSVSDKDSAVAVDGKTLKGARKHLLSAFLHQQACVLAQQPVEGKTNEISTVRPLLDPLDLKGRVVTLDAMHTQKETAHYLVKEKRADYLFIVKDNQQTLRRDIEDLRMVDFPPSVPDHR
jgi:hypothetical protein